ncbi:MAG TPA: hypothetical protein G4N96_08685 [Chloroflexi bacterium]|nr:hypothetical protein [Chloroflexota bacterium]
MAEPVTRQELLNIIENAAREGWTELNLSGRAITELPPEIGQLSNLQELGLDNNPLNPALQSAYNAGLDEVLAYLRSLEEEAEPLYEARLMLVGEGAVGKTTLLRALTGQDPQKDKKTTHGVSIDIQALRLPHLTLPKTEIQFNCRDFGGQEVYRATHQFFFSRRAIYLLLWEPRGGVQQQGQVEEWLKLIRLRVGNEARVIIVSTHAKTGERIARIDEPVFRRNFGEMIVAFQEVDSLVDDEASGDKFGVAELKWVIAEAAQKLDQVGIDFNQNWKAARDELLELGQSEARISYSRFVAVCREHTLGTLAARTLMHDRR